MQNETHGSNGHGSLLEETTPKKARGAKKEETVTVNSRTPKMPQRKNLDVATYVVTCSQLSGLLMDRFSEEAMIGTLGKGERKPIDKTSLIESRCLDKIYRDADGNPCLQAEHILSCLKAAGRSIKIGKEGKISTASETKLFSFFELEGETIPLNLPEGKDPKIEKPFAGAESAENNDSTSPWRVSCKRGVGEATGVANLLIRPLFEKWGFTLRFTVDYTALEGLTDLHIAQLLERAGSRVGLLSFRPACNGPYGRFRVDSVDFVSND